jgi:hypothetical protein
MVLGGYSYLHGHITESFTFLELLYNASFLGLLGLGVAVLGIAFGLVGSLIGTYRYLRLV